MFVVTMDQRDSRSSPDHVPTLLDALSGVETVAEFERTAGDEVQALLSSPEAVRTTVLTALRFGDWHCGIGVGAVESGSYATGTRAGRGAAYLAAREAVEAAKSAGGPVAVRVAEDAPASARDWAADCEAVWTLVAALVTDRTEAQWRVVDMVDRTDTQAAAAEALGMTPTSVAGALRRSGIRAERAAHPVLDRLLLGADRADGSDDDGGS